MAARITSPALINARDRLAQLGGAQAELAAEVDKHGTRVIFSSLISGGFTLNVIKTIFVDPHLQEPQNFDLLVCILAHEFSHVRQGHLVDSVQQELIAYQAAAQAALAMNYDYGKQLYTKYSPLDPGNLPDLEKALGYMLEQAAGSLSTQTIYKSLPKFQPTGLADNSAAAIRQLSAAAVAGIQALRREDK